MTNEQREYSLGEMDLQAEARRDALVQVGTWLLEEGGGVEAILLTSCRNGCDPSEMVVTRDYEWQIYCGSCYDCDCDSEGFHSSAVLATGRTLVKAADEWNRLTGDLKESDYSSLLTVSAPVARAA